MNFKILNIYAKNFKTFKEISFECKKKDVVIIGGKNGYGKTTLFDIIELALTGEIKRYKYYADKFTDKRIQRIGNDKPLVNDSQKNEVIVQIDVMLDSEEYRLKRIAKTECIDFLLGFDAFKNLNMEKKINGKWETVTDEQKISYHLAEIKKNYSRFYYLPQEETLEYLKSKEKDRPAELQKLFDVSFFDEKIKSIVFIKEQLKEKIALIEEKKQKIENELQNLVVNIQNTEDVDYERMASDVELSWDTEDINENFDFQAALSAGGVIDDLIYFVENQKYYHQYKKSQLLEKLKVNKNNIALWFQYRNLIKDIEEYKAFIKDNVEPVNQITIDTIGSFTFEKFDQTNYKIRDLISRLSLLKISEKSFKGLERCYGQLNEIKTKIIPYITEESKIKKCPFCGHDYKNALELVESLKNFSSIEQNLKREMHIDLVFGISLFKERIKKEILTPKMEYYKKIGISDDIAQKIDQISLGKKKEFENLIDEIFKIDLSGAKSLEDRESIIESFINANSVELDSTIDYERLNNVYVNTAYLISADKLTIESVKRKRQYLLNKWNIVCNKKEGLLKKELSLCNAKLKNAKSYNDKIKNAEKNLSLAKKAYLNKIINDVKILFYIYSGRIMQDCFYGRGLFLVYNEKKGYVNFTSSPNSGVDALYKLSSGQMVALILSFTLSLNKLYRKLNFMLIDDPIQCIDDINIWGLFETLRHEFQNYSFIFSTHEGSYATLLRYRLNKFGFNVEYRDLLKEGKRN